MCYLDDDGGPQIVVAEDADSHGRRQALWVRVGPVFHGSEQDKDPAVWVEYQPEYMKSELVGCVLIDVPTWRALNAAVEERLTERGL